MTTAEDPTPATDTSAAGTALIKSLGACSASTRSKTLKALISWLQQQQQPQPPLSDDDVKKLWKGLFYCVWHSDKAPNQASLINRLSSLLLSLSPQLSLSYFSNFLLTLRREWPGIDRLRLDKFYLMIRVFVAKLFELLRKQKWSLDVVDRYWGVLEERLFVCQDGGKSLGDGVAYHVVSVFCEEIRAFLPLRLEVLNVLFRPFVSVLGKTDNKVLLGKLKSDVFGHLVKSGRGLLVVKKSGEEEVDSKDERVLFGTIALVMGFSARFYELGSSPDCVQGNRKFLFSLHEEFLKLEKEFQVAGIDVKLSEVDGNEDDDDEEVPQLVPISENDVEGGKVESSDKPKKKKKKKDKGGSKDKENKKKKKKKSMENGVNGSSENEDADMLIDTTKDGDSVEPDSPKLSDATLSYLQKQFEMIAAESGMEQGVSSSLDSPVKGNGEVTKKRKRGKKKANGKVSADSNLAGEPGAEDENNATTAEKSRKKVKFSMRHNLVWNPANPLPPQSVRIPPSVTPRGSALKKGVPPGPVREMFSGAKKAKKKKAAKSKSPAIKRIKKLRSMSA